jgi:hypothetical protein
MNITPDLRKHYRYCLSVLSFFCLSLSGILCLAIGSESPIFLDKNRLFQVVPPVGWIKKEYDDPRTKIRFSAPQSRSQGIAPSIFFLAHPLVKEIDLEQEAKRMLERLCQMNAKDTSLKMISFAGTTAAQLDATISEKQLRFRNLMLKQFGAYYVISYSASPASFGENIEIVSKVFGTFQCLPPEEGDTSRSVPTLEQGKVLAARIRVWITALSDEDAGIDAEKSLIAIGCPALPALRDAIRNRPPGVLVDRAKRIISTIEGNSR